MLTLSTRPAKIGNQIQSRGENHGEDSVTAIDIPLTNVMLDEREFNALMGEPNAFNAFFDRSRGLAEPAFTRLKPLALSEKIEGARVTIKHGLQAEELHLTNARRENQARADDRRHRVDELHRAVCADARRQHCASA